MANSTKHNLDELFAKLNRLGCGSAIEVIKELQAEVAVLTQRITKAHYDALMLALDSDQITHWYDDGFDCDVVTLPDLEDLANKFKEQ